MVLNILFRAWESGHNLEHVNIKINNNIISENVNIHIDNKDLLANISPFGRQAQIRTSIPIQFPLGNILKPYQKPGSEFALPRLEAFDNPMFNIKNMIASKSRGKQQENTSESSQV